jgi:hypothetical protein
MEDRENSRGFGECQDYANCHQASQIGAALVDNNPVWHAVCADNLLKNLRAAARSRRSGDVKSRGWISRSTAQ